MLVTRIFVASAVHVLLFWRHCQYLACAAWSAVHCSYLLQAVAACMTSFSGSIPSNFGSVLDSSFFGLLLVSLSVARHFPGSVSVCLFFAMW